MTFQVTKARTYESTHPWLDFQLDLRRAPLTLWTLLGEAKSKSEHVKRSLLKPEAARELNEVYLAKGALATTAIEGNTLTEEQALAAIEGRLSLPPSQEYLQREITNIVSACNSIVDELVDDPNLVLSPDRIKQFNLMVLEGLEPEEGVTPGEIREHSAVVGRYRGAPYEDCDYLLNRLCDWLSGETFVAPDSRLAIPYAILKAIVAHLYLAWIHPFGDGNGRTARLVELQVLLSAGFATPAAHLLSNHYNLTRSKYHRELDRTSRDGPTGNEIDFLVYGVDGLVDGLHSQSDRIWRQQLEDRWEQHIYESFGHTSSSAELRRRRLVLDISKQTGPVRLNEMRALSPAVAEAYAGMTPRTLARDLETLLARGLLEEIDDGAMRPRRELLLAFRPLTPVDGSPSVENTD